MHCVARIFTDLPEIDITPDEPVLREVAPGYIAAVIQAVTEPRPLSCQRHWQGSPHEA